MSAEVFDDLTDIYEATIDWSKRLANEQPFYRRLIDRIKARSALDVACGTGHHAAMLHSCGLNVEGADISPKMIERSRQRHGESDSLRWVVRGYEQLVDHPGSFDLAICVGNSLALAGDAGVAQRAVHQMLGAVRSGGAAVVHVLNLWRLPDGPCMWQKCVRAKLNDGDSLITKGVHRCGSRGYVQLVIADLTQSPPALRSESIPFLGMETSELNCWATAAGASITEFFGDYAQNAYVREQSQDLIMLAIMA